MFHTTYSSNRNYTISLVYSGYGLLTVSTQSVQEMLGLQFIFPALYTTVILLIRFLNIYNQLRYFEYHNPFHKFQSCPSLFPSSLGYYESVTMLFNIGSIYYRIRKYCIICIFLTDTFNSL